MCPSVRIVRKNTLWFLATQMWGGLLAVGDCSLAPPQTPNLPGPLFAQTGVTAIYSSL